MTNREILEKAISRAIEGGWHAFHYGNPSAIFKWNFDEDKNAFYWGQYEDYEEIKPSDYIFDHAFAKALWGDDDHLYCVEFPEGDKRQSFHLCYLKNLQEMVIADDPIKYLGDNI